MIRQSQAFLDRKLSRSSEKEKEKEKNEIWNGSIINGNRIKITRRRKRNELTNFEKGKREKER